MKEPLRAIPVTERESPSEDERSQGRCHANQQNARFVVEEDGRPQGLHV
ncbi:MAG TPA: hypothetical protein VNG51_16830 [Ktedonobacteraceae bacterium]|nr:hypothetical protein [Ktedonobacteraceae bacterium]